MKLIVLLKETKYLQLLHGFFQKEKISNGGDLKKTNMYELFWSGE